MIKCFLGCYSRLNKYISIKNATFQTSPAALFTPTASYYPSSSATKLSTSSLARIDEGKPVSASSNETIPYVDESFDTRTEKETTSTTTYQTQSSVSVKSDQLQRVGSEKRLRFAVPVSEIADTDSSSSEQHSHRVSFPKLFILSLFHKLH